MTSITIRQLDPEVKEKLRILAAQNGRSMEAQVRDILARAVETWTPADANEVDSTTKFDGLVGTWKPGLTTDELMEELRGDE